MAMSSDDASEEEGVPINQEHMLVTGLVFSMGPLKGAESLGVKISAKVRCEYLGSYNRYE